LSRVLPNLPRTLEKRENDTSKKAAAASPRLSNITDRDKRQ